ncbi:MAG: hypothetical protein ACE5OZ_07525 [Candidatus Heimdallarchaeota archaeon]
MGVQSLGKLRSLIVFPKWIFFADPDWPTEIGWRYKNQDVETIHVACVIFIPADFLRLIIYNRSYLLLYGAGIYWTKFSLVEKAVTTDMRYLTGLVIPEEKWLDNHFSTEPFVFPPPYDDFMVLGENLLEFSFNSLQAQEDLAEQSRLAFRQDIILSQLVFPLKEPLILLRKATENGEFEKAPMRVLISEFWNVIFLNEIVLESANSVDEENIPGVRRIKPYLSDAFPKQWSYEAYLDGLRRRISEISKDFANIGAPMLLK